MHFLERCWYGHHLIAQLLRPLSWLFRALSAARRFAYRRGLLAVHRVPIPVIVVGNITVGGTGKTPVVIWLAELLRQCGHRPAIVSRGYGGRAPVWPQAVTPDSDPALVGDEAVLLARRTGCPVVVAPRRASAADHALRHNDCDIIISDDGLQHYALHRDLEIAVVDGTRRFGNGLCLPAGPLREPVRRLAEVDLVVTDAAAPAPGEFRMSRRAGDLCRVGNPGVRRALAAFSGASVHAVAGIGQPERFFATLRAAGLQVQEHPFPDHHPFSAADLAFADDRPVIMTEKDAVKCVGYDDGRFWYLELAVEPEPTLVDALRERLNRLRFAAEAGEHGRR